MKTTFFITAISRVTLEHDTKGGKPPIHVATDMRLEVSEALNKSQYVDQDDLPTKDGAKSLTIGFIQGIITNVHMSEQNGFWNKAEHLKYIFDEISKGVTAEVIVTKADF